MEPSSQTLARHQRGDSPRPLKTIEVSEQRAYLIRGQRGRRGSKKRMAAAALRLSVA